MRPERGVSRHTGVLVVQVVPAKVGHLQRVAGHTSVVAPRVVQQRTPRATPGDVRRRTT